MQAFRRLYDMTSPKLFGFALRILGKREIAEEALQDSFVGIWHHAASYQARPGGPHDLDDHHRAQQGVRHAAPRLSTMPWKLMRIH